MPVIIFWWVYTRWTSFCSTLMCILHEYSIVSCSCLNQRLMQVYVSVFLFSGGFLGLERGMCKAADPCVWLGAAKSHTECAVSTTCQNVHESCLPGRSAWCNGYKQTVTGLACSKAVWILHEQCSASEGY